jgi:hypothetical protein
VYYNAGYVGFKQEWVEIGLYSLGSPQIQRTRVQHKTFGVGCMPNFGKEIYLISLLFILFMMIDAISPLCL